MLLFMNYYIVVLTCTIQLYIVNMFALRCIVTMVETFSLSWWTVLSF